MPTTAASVLDGTKIAAQIRSEVAAEVRQLTAQSRPPGLAVILAGNNPASEIYVRNKIKACQEVGIYSEKITPSANVSTAELLQTVEELNRRDEIDGILVQLPLPDGVDAKKVLLAVSPDKDVDGFHPLNAGRLAQQRPGLTPCTPAGVIEILKRSSIAIEGAHAVVIGRSDIVGRPMALLLLNNNATVTICHSRTSGLAQIARQGDILVAAAGKPGLVTEEFVKRGAVVIDVGIHRVDKQEDFNKFFAGDPEREKTFREKGSVLLGDVHPRAAQIAGAVTPVPGGVGPLTIAMLMANTVKAFRLRREQA
ncbi:MAG TPA: bifunctional methylenetetrahydrofolate dehydrogenase/methenyltetrahydrofolate cyclohydrolase FolD [Candidatus Limnocylindrales bacterium]|jgi:methylenetetrahydrofolate dehydrogenase (NADP+)/methenyltetrahydrofolate cyclohydrolase|nr:bifunctional methylenetetrahydrofolate dehydrogenase/methenyltetrahydrofolate cyclohydrolase FolD [Candidatus Limnocylindrales bacterium]